MLPKVRRYQPENWLYFNVKLIRKLLNGDVIREFHPVMTEPEMDKLTTHDIWNDGHHKSVTIYVDGEFYCNWRLSRGERPLAV